MSETIQDSVKSEELSVFFFTTVVLIPAIAVTIVVGYGFSVWISQILMGPPGL